MAKRIKHTKLCCEGKFHKDPFEPCRQEYSCYIDAPDYFNCFFTYMFFHQGKQHTLQEVAKLMKMSHTTVKCIEDGAIQKLQQRVIEGDLTLEELRAFVSPEKD